MKLDATLRRGQLGWAGAIVGATLLIGGGCESQKPTGPTRPVRDTSPQAKYDRVLAEIRRLLSPDTSATRGRYIQQNEAGSGTTVTKYNVVAPEKLVIPTNGEAPQVTVEITQSSTYSFLPPPKKVGEEENDSDSEQDDSRRDPLGELNTNLKDMGVEVLDPEKLQQDLEKAARSRIAPPQSTTRTKSTEKRVTYDLIYENDRWRLARPPAADAMDATNMAIQQSLQRQL